MLRDFAADERGSMGFFVVFVAFTIITLFLFAFATPLMIDFNVHMYSAGEDLLNDSQEVINNIQDQQIKQELQSALDQAKSSTAENVSVLSWFYQYGWVFVIIVGTFTIIMLARRTVERQQIT